MIGLVLLLFRLFEFLILARVVLSWIGSNRTHPIIDWVYRLTEPILDPIRRLIPMERIGIDFSPVIVLLLIQVIKRIVIRSLLAF